MYMYKEESKAAIKWTVNIFLLIICIQEVTSAPEKDKRSPVDINKADIKQEMLPIVLWHGMGDSCCNENSIGGIKTRLEEEYGIFVHSISLGETEYDDIKAGYLGNVNEQIEEVCNKLSTLPELKNGFNAVGFSQGGQFLRAVLERCQHKLPQMHVLVTMGGQHQGVTNVPSCNVIATWSTWCYVLEWVVRYGAYLPWIRDNVVQAQYVKDPLNYDSYLEYNEFLADINNDKNDKSSQYKNNMITLSKFVMFRFTNDTMVVPRDSAWFYYYNGEKVLRLEDQETYKEDWIGLKTLDKANKIVFDECVGDHMQFSFDWFFENVVEKYLYLT